MIKKNTVKLPIPGILFFTLASLMERYIDNKGKSVRKTTTGDIIYEVNYHRQELRGN
jgi:hypothetical protein